MEGTGFLGQAAENVYHLEADDLYLVGTSEVPLAAYAHGRDPRRRARCRCAMRVSRRASAARPARTARTPAASSGCTSSTRWRCSPSCRPEDAAAEHQRLLDWEKEFLTIAGAAVPGDRRRRRATWAPARRASSTARRGSLPRAVPRADLGVELHRVPGPPAGDPDARRRRHSGRVATLNGTLCAMTAHHRRDAREPPAGRRVGVGAGGAAPVPRSRRPRAGHPVSAEPVVDAPGQPGWVPRVVASGPGRHGGGERRHGRATGRRGRR